MARTPIVLTHGPGCLDGAAAAACITRTRTERPPKVVFCHPSEADDHLERITKSEELKDIELWITDITWRKEETDARLKRAIDEGAQVFWVDHHQNAIERQQSILDSGCVTGSSVSTDYSAARLTYDFLKDREPGEPTASLDSFWRVVEMADDHDRWIHKVDGSRDLALAVSIMSGSQSLDQLTSLPDGRDINDHFAEFLSQARRKLEESVKLAKSTCTEFPLDDEGTVLLCALCRGFSSEVADRLRGSRKKTVVALVGLDDMKGSLRRSPDCTVNLAAVASKLGGGGHIAAAGFELQGLSEKVVSIVGGDLVKAIQNLK